MKEISENKRTWAVNGVAYLFIVLFVYAAVSKILDFENFRVQLAQSPLLSAYASFISWAVPVIEIVIAVFLMLSHFRIFALYASFSLMVMFTAYIYIILNFSDFVPCSCGGVLEKLSWGEHLVFNLVFIVLAGVPIFLSRHWNLKKKLSVLGLLVFLGISVVTLLFVFSEKKMHRNNAFQRRYLPHAIKIINNLDLKYSSYYFAGVENGKIYLGNTTAPLLMTIIDSSLSYTSTTMIELDQMNLPYRSVNIRVTPPYFYVADGTVPILLVGKTQDWLAKTEMHGDFYFNQWVPIDAKKIVVKSNSSETGENIIGIIEIEDSVKGIFSNKILEKQIDGIFDTDGKLIYNSLLQKVIYVYNYRNQFILTDENLGVDFRGKTIDTVSKAQLQIDVNVSKNEQKLGGNTLFINKGVATTRNFLMINSPRIGKHEPSVMLDEAAIIDIYDLSEKSYEFSFYLYNHKRKKVREFIINNRILYALQGNYLVTYKLEKEF